LPLLVPLLASLPAAAQTINISSGVFNSARHGNSSNPDGTLYNLAPVNNTLNLSGSAQVDIPGHLYGGRADTGDVTANTVTASDSARFYAIHGGYADTGDVTRNTVIIGDQVQGSIVWGGFTFFGDAAQNAVTIGGEAIISSSVYGGYLDGTGVGNVRGNSVFVGGRATVGVVVLGGYNFGTGSATNNSVFVGENAAAVHAVGGQSTTGGDATDNTVSIGGGARISGSVRGGMTGSGNNAIRNTVNISGAPDLTTAALYGGFGGTDFFSGNTLHLRVPSRLNAASAQNFEHYNFYLPSTAHSGDILLQLSGAADLTDGGARRSAVNVRFLDPAAAPDLRSGDYIALIDASGGITGAPANSASTAVGVTRSYTFTLGVFGNQLRASLASASVTPGAEALSQGMAASVAALNQGADLLAATLPKIAREPGWHVFGDIAGGKSRYDAGADVDVSGLSLISGVSRGFDLKPGTLVFGGFFEYGNGAYVSRNSFADAPSVTGEGTSRHYGGGLLGRFETPFLSGVAYLEGSGRMGHTDVWFSSDDLRDSSGRAASYESGATYYGVHAGLGHIWNIVENGALDLYGKYLWIRRESNDVTLSTGDEIEFGALDSRRLRLGARYSHAVSPRFAPYVGAAWEHEFDGRARATTAGLDIPSSSTRGDTGIGEAGFVFRPSDALPLSLDLGVQGYAGKREGVSGSLYVKYEF
jgi:outer membrane autotransporter protein